MSTDVKQEVETACLKLNRKNSIAILSLCFQADFCYVMNINVCNCYLSVFSGSTLTATFKLSLQLYIVVINFKHNVLVIGLLIFSPIITQTRKLKMVNVFLPQHRINTESQIPSKKQYSPTHTSIHHQTPCRNIKHQHSPSDTNIHH